MWSTILSFGGWVTFGGFLVLYVGWVAVEREFFAAGAVEDGQPDLADERLPVKEGQSARLVRLARVASL